jgi:hypothetical protein
VSFHFISFHSFIHHSLSNLSSSSFANMNINIHPISGLNDQIKNWSIRGLCTYKSTKTCPNGSKFSFILKDHTGEISIVAFREHADHFYDSISTGQVFFLSSATVKLIDPKYRKNNKFEIVLSKESSRVEPVTNYHHQEREEELEDEHHRHSFTLIKDIPSIQSNLDMPINLIAVVKTISVPKKIVTNGNFLFMRKLTLIDDSQHSITLLFWSKDLDQFNDHDNVSSFFANNPVIIVKNAMLTSFKGISLTTIPTTHISFNDIEIARVKELTKRYDMVKRLTHFCELSAP